MALAIPELTRADVVFGSIKHIPKYDTLPDEFQRQRGPFCEAVQQWFFRGAKIEKSRLVIDGKAFTPKPGIDMTKALAAIKAALGSFEPKHEHKIAGCGFLLAEWFDLEGGG